MSFELFAHKTPPKNPNVALVSEEKGAQHIIHRSLHDISNVSIVIYIWSTYLDCDSNRSTHFLCNTLVV